MQAHSKYIRTAPRKIRLILDEIRGMNAVLAEQRLHLMAKQAAHDVEITLHTAIHNAKDQGVATDTLLVAEAKCDEGPRMKRRILGSRGRAKPIVKQSSHIFVALRAESAKALPAAPAKKPEGSDGA